MKIDLKKLRAGEWIKYTGTLITVRDSSMMRLLENKHKLPIDLKGKIVMYAAPTESKVIVIGPTTSSRMDSSLGFILGKGVVATIGKGARSKDAINEIKKHKAPYFILMSGVSAYLSQFFKKGKIIAMKELGPEAIRKYHVENLPLLVAIDPSGKTIF